MLLLPLTKTEAYDQRTSFWWAQSESCYYDEGYLCNVVWVWHHDYSQQKIPQPWESKDLDNLIACPQHRLLSFCWNNHNSFLEAWELLKQKWERQRVTSPFWNLNDGTEVIVNFLKPCILLHLFLVWGIVLLLSKVSVTVIWLEQKGL